MLDFFPHIAPYLVLLIIGVAFMLIYLNKTTPLKALMFSSALLLVLDMVSMEDILTSVANPSILLILALIIIAAGLIRHYPILKYINKLTVSNRGYKPFLATSMGITALFSAVINNTAVVAFMTPFMHHWGMKNKVSPGKLLLPLSFAAISGGMITVIGTSTTLVLNGFMKSEEIPGLDYGFLLITGLTVTIICILYFVVIGHRLLPENPELLELIIKSKKDYLVELRIKQESPLNGKSISAAGMRNLQSFYLVEIIRNDETFAPVAPDLKLQANDILIFAGDTRQLNQLLSEDLGLELPNTSFENEGFKRMNEVVVSHNSSLIGMNIRNTEFRQQFDASIVAVHRNGARLRGKIGDNVLLPGDVLLVFSGDEFEDKTSTNHDLYVISESERSVINKPLKWPLIMIGALVGYGLIFHKIGLPAAAFIILSVLFIAGILDIKILKKEFDLSLAGILVFSLVIGKAIINTGAGKMVGDLIFNLSQNSPVISLFFIIMITVLLTTFITNVAAVSIIFPVALQLSVIYPDSGPAFFMGIAFAASAAFLTPVSYQTNLMVVGPGGYTFQHFFKNGLPYMIIYLLVVMGLMWGFYM